MSLHTPIRSLRSLLHQPTHYTPTLSTVHSPRRRQQQHHHQQTRPFITLPDLSSFTSTTQPLQTLTATRTLPYPRREIYSIIADVQSYPQFLPYCASSSVTAWSRPDDLPGWGRKWPEEAVLEVGWKGVREKFRSRIYCVPGSIVEAVGGGAETRLAAGEVAHHAPLEKNGVEGGQGHDRQAGSEILTHLLTRWTVKSVGGRGGEGKGEGEKTDVTLNIEYRFASPMYSVMAGAFADKVAGVMIEAFEKRVVSVIDGAGPKRVA